MRKNALSLSCTSIACPLVFTLMMALASISHAESENSSTVQPPVNAGKPSAIRALSWGVPQLIQVDEMQDADHPQLVIDHLGNITAAWSQLGETVENIWANRYVPGMGWSTAQKIEFGNQDNALYPRLAVDRTGNVTVISEQKAEQSNNSRVWSTRYDIKTGWGSAKPIERDDKAISSDAQLAVDEAGIVTAVWMKETNVKQDIQKRDIWASRYIPGAGWSKSPRKVNTMPWYTTGPALTVTSAGDVLIAWEEFIEGRRRIVSTLLPPSAAQTAPQPISTGAVLNAGNSSSVLLAADHADNVSAVWEKVDFFGALSLWSNRYDAKSGWEANAQLITETDNDQDTYLSDPDRVVDGKGNITVAWERESNDVSHIWINHYDAAIQQWSTAQPIPEASGFNPKLAVDSVGNVIVIWLNTDSNKVTRIWSSRYGITSGKWSAPVPVDTPNVDGNVSAMRPQIAIANKDRAIVVWKQVRGGLSNVYSVHQE